MANTLRHLDADDGPRERFIPFQLVVPGGQHDEIATNAAGGKQSKIHGKPTEFPPLAYLEISKVMGTGSERYPREPDGSPNWHRIDCFSNLDHGLEHAARFLAERNKPDRNLTQMLEELSHHAARACMALEQFLREHPEVTP